MHQSTSTTYSSMAPSPKKLPVSHSSTACNANQIAAPVDTTSMAFVRFSLTIAKQSAAKLICMALSHATQLRGIPLIGVCGRWLISEGVTINANIIKAARAEAAGRGGSLHLPTGCPFAI